MLAPITTDRIAMAGKVVLCGCIGIALSHDYDEDGVQFGIGA